MYSDTGGVVRQIAVDLGLEQYGDAAYIKKAIWLPGSTVCATKPWKPMEEVAFISCFAPCVRNNIAHQLHCFYSESVRRDEMRWQGT